ncbi:MAG: DUF1573 domain-containing protein [Planctomycetes bacterium]|nr:DUF1573 domain-containing protein [Planctomycetota bacterium]
MKQRPSPWLRLRLIALACAPAVASTAFAQLPPTPPEGRPQAAEPKPRLFVAERIKDLGKLIDGDKATIRWRLENQGTADLVIERTQAACGCTVVQLREEEKVIRPGSVLELTAEFDSTKRRGEQAKTVVVHSNDPIEPALKLEFKAEVEALVELDPQDVVNLRNVQRGATSPQTLSVMPGGKQREVEVLGLDVPAGAPITYAVEPLGDASRPGGRIRFTVTEAAPLGRLAVDAKLKVRVDGTELDRPVLIRGEVVSELTWQPKVVDATRVPSNRGKALAPVLLQSPTKVPFDVLEVSAGPLLSATFEETQKAQARTEYLVKVTVRDDAPAGPFAAMLGVRTSCLDQPLIEIPVYGMVAAPVEIEPPLLLLRQDGSPVGSRRRMKLQAATDQSLELGEMVCDEPAVQARVDSVASAPYRHLRFVDVELNGRVPPGTHRTVLRVSTNVRGAERLDIPVVIEAPP